MLKSAAIFTTLATLGLSFIGDPKKTAVNILTVISLRGVALASVKVTEVINPKAAKVIDFTAWCLCAGAVIEIISISFSAWSPFVSLVVKVTDGTVKVIKFLKSLA